MGLCQTRPPCSSDRQPQKAFCLKSMGQLWARHVLSWDYPLHIPGFENILCPRAGPSPLVPMLQRVLSELGAAQPAMPQHHTAAVAACD